MNEAWFSFIGTGFWGWFIAGILMMTAELFIPGVFIVWIGIGALLTGVVAAFFPDISVSYQLLFFAVFSDMM